MDEGELEDAFEGFEGGLGGSLVMLVGWFFCVVFGKDGMWTEEGGRKGRASGWVGCSL